MKGEQGTQPAKRHVGESYKDYSDRLYGMYRAVLNDLEVRQRRQDGDLAGPPRATVPACDPARLPVDDWLYERAEDACGQGLPLEDALTAVRNGYSSIEFDRRYAAEEFAEEAP